MPKWDSPCECPPHDFISHRIRKMPGDLTIGEYATECLRRGLEPEIRFVQRETCDRGGCTLPADHYPDSACDYRGSTYDGD
jgi:hypothetical protein